LSLIFSLMIKLVIAMQRLVLLPQVM